MAVIPGAIPVTGFIGPTDSNDTYAVTDAIYGVDGLRNVDDATVRDAITPERRRKGMIVGTKDDGKYWKLLTDGPWNYDSTDWDLFIDAGAGPIAPGLWENIGGNIVTASTFTSPGPPNVLPFFDDMQDLGSKVNRWKDLYLGSVIDFSSVLDFVVGGGSPDDSIFKVDSYGINLYGAKSIKSTVSPIQIDLNFGGGGDQFYITTDSGLAANATYFRMKDGAAGDIEFSWSDGLNIGGGLSVSNSGLQINWSDSPAIGNFNITASSILLQHTQFIEFNSNVRLNSTFVIKDDLNSVSIDTNNRLLYDSGASQAIDYEFRNLYDGTGTNISLDWSTYETFDSTSATSINWDTRVMSSSNGAPSVSWEVRRMHDAASTLSVDWDLRTLVNGQKTVDWGNEDLINPVTMSIDGTGSGMPLPGFQYKILGDYSALYSIGKFVIIEGQTEYIAHNDNGTHLITNVFFDGTHTNIQSPSFSGTYFGPSLGTASILTVTVSWALASLTDLVGVQSLNWNSRILYDETGTNVIRYTGNEVHLFGASLTGTNMASMSMSVVGGAVSITGDSGVTLQSSTGYGFNVSAVNLTTLNGADISITSDDSITITAGAAGAEYAANYSAGYTNRSLVDKEYVDAVFSSNHKYVYSGAFTGGTIVTVTHGLGTDEVICDIINTSTGAKVWGAKVENYTTTSIDITISVSGTYKVIIIG